MRKATGSRARPDYPVVMCDVCGEPASRVLFRGKREERRFACDVCGDDGSTVFCAGKRANDEARAMPERELVYRMRLQNYRRGLLSLGRFGALERRDGPRPYAAMRRPER